MIFFRCRAVKSFVDGFRRSPRPPLSYIDYIGTAAILMVVPARDIPVHRADSGAAEGIGAFGGRVIEGLPTERANHTIVYSG
jgi:hypothetical protein